MSIADWPEDDRPREKLLARGANALTDAELLAIFLRTGTKGKSALDLATDLLNEFGDLRSLLSASQHRFCEAKGLGPAKFVQLQACLELSRRYLKRCMQRGTVIQHSEDVRNYLIGELSGRLDEVFGCLFLDNKNRVIRFEELFQGTLDSANVYPRVVARRALELNAAAIILTHNHPSGVAEPSRADIAITHTLQKALQLFNIRLLDHLIIGDGYAVSLAERQLLIAK
jgi:DNA repair protein RadC